MKNAVGEMDEGRGEFKGDGKGSKMVSLWKCEDG